MSKRILVTGCSGFIGSHLTEALLKQGHWVRGVDRLPNKYLNCAPSEYVNVDLCRYEECLAATYDIDQVFHLASETGGLSYRNSNQALPVRNNTVASANLLEACRAHRVGRFLFASSAAVYPMPRQRSFHTTPLVETDVYPAMPEEAFGWEKLFTEQLCNYYARDFGLEVRIARCDGIYGPQMHYEGGKEQSVAAICREISQAKDDGSIVVWGDGKQRRSLLFVSDCVEALIAIMNSEVSSPFNVSSNDYLSINELAEKVIALSGKRLTRKNDPAKIQGARNRKSDNSKLHELLGWEQKTPLDKGLQITYRWIDQQLGLSSELNSLARPNIRPKSQRIRAISRSVSTSQSVQREKKSA